MSFRALVLPAALVSLAACGTFQSYRLPMSSFEGYSTFAPIAAAANQAGYVVAEHRDSVNVQVDPDIWAQFMIQGTQYNMVLIMTNDDKVTPEQRDVRFVQAKSKADEIWTKALELRAQTALPAGYR